MRVEKPFSTRVSLEPKQDYLEIVIPPRGFVDRSLFRQEFNLCEPCVACFLILIGLITVPCSIIVGPLFPLVAWVVIILFIKKPLCQIFVNILKVTLRHNRQRFSVKYELFGFEICRGRYVPEDFLTEEEIRWLEYELRHWSNSSITRFSFVGNSVTSVPRWMGGDN